MFGSEKSIENASVCCYPALNAWHWRKAVDPAAEQWPATQGVEASIIHALARQPAADQRQANRSGGGLGHPRAGVAVECEWQSQAASLQ